MLGCEWIELKYVLDLTVRQARNGTVVIVNVDYGVASRVEIAIGTGKFTNLLRESVAIRHLTTVEPPADCVIYVRSQYVHT